METTTLSTRIETILREQNIRATELAKVAGVSDSTVTLWKNGTTSDMRAENALMIQRKYGYRIEWIVTGEGPKTVEESKQQQAQEVIRQKIRDGDLIDISRLPDPARHALKQTAAAFTSAPP